MQTPKRPASPGKERLSAVARAIGKRLRSPKKTYESPAEKRASHGGDVPKEVRMAAVGEYEKLAVNGKLPRGAASRLVARLSSYSISICSPTSAGTTTPATGATASARASATTRTGTSTRRRSRRRRRRQTASRRSSTSSCPATRTTRTRPTPTRMTSTPPTTTESLRASHPDPAYRGNSPAP